MKKIFLVCLVLQTWVICAAEESLTALKNKKRDPMQRVMLQTNRIGKNDPDCETTPLRKTTFKKLEKVGSVHDLPKE